VAPRTQGSDRRLRVFGVNDPFEGVRVASPCSQDWSAMRPTAATGQGPDSGSSAGAARFCDSCQKSVVDFVSLTPREIRARLEASRGHLCGRLTRSTDGRLVTRPASADEMQAAAGLRALDRWSSPIAAALMSAFLGSAATDEALAQEVAPAEIVRTVGDSVDEGERPVAASAQAVARIRGSVTDEDGGALPGFTFVARNTLDGHETTVVSDARGEFLVEAESAGIYEVAGELDGFTPVAVGDLALTGGDDVSLAFTSPPSIREVTMGVIAMVARPMHEVFAESPLVVLATAGRTRVVEDDGEGWGLVETELLVDEVLKGELRRSRIFYQRYDSWENEDGDIVGSPEDLSPRRGEEVLAFLAPSTREENAKRRRVYEAADGEFGVRVLDRASSAAYRERLRDLERITRFGKPAPDVLAEWLVATAEDPLTRGESVSEILSAYGELDRVAERRSLGVEEAAEQLRQAVRRFREDGGEVAGESSEALLGASFTDNHRERLLDALVSTGDDVALDLGLFDVVRRWAPEEAKVWLRAAAGELPTDVAGDSVSEALWTRSLIADALGDQRLTDWATEAVEKVAAVEHPEEAESEEAALERLRAFGREAFDRFAALLEEPRQNP
jgi:hypothetical protein